MAGIAALVHLDGRPVAGGDLEAMLAPLRLRGPEGSSRWCEGEVGLGHTRLTTTPEAGHEPQPFVDADARLAVVADLRLDNRDELLGRLGLRDRDPGRLGDAELVLRSYQRWGRSCPEHLLGDFAFALWDGPRRRLFCARDHLGVKPLCYHAAPGRLVAVASAPAALLALGAVPYRINEGRIADFLVGDLEGIDQTSTFFEGICRLPPAHTLTVDRDGWRTAQYWILEPGPELRLPSDSAYDEAFLEVFTDAVECRLRNHGVTGSMLSGGMDSGAIVAVARGLQADAGRPPLPTFSAVAAVTEGCVESGAVRAAQTMEGIVPHTVSPATWHHLQPDLDEPAWAVEEPFDAHMTLVRAVYLESRRQGTTVVLDGIDGDNVLCEGSQLRCLLRQGRWRTAHREAVGVARFWGVGPTGHQLLHGAARQAFVPEAAKRAYRRWRPKRRVTSPEARLRGSLITREFAERIDLAGRLRTLDAHTRERDGWPGLGWERARALEHPYLTVGLERYDRVAASIGVEPRHPFLDLRLVAFCLSLPGDQKLAGGWPKVILRRSMAGRLPDAVRWRRGKEHLGYTFTRELLGRDPGRLAEVIDAGRPVLEGYLDVDAAMRAATDPDEQQQAFTAAHLAQWLDHHRQRSARSITSRMSPY